MSKNLSTVTISVTGMSCGHCVASVTEELTAVDGVESVQVDLVPKGTSQVSIEVSTQLSDATIRGAIEEAGFGLADGPS